MKACCLFLCLSLMTAFTKEAMAQKAKMVTYVVQEGDTCERIAQKLYGNKKLVKIIYLYNYFPSANHEVKTGQKLFVVQEQPEAKLTKQEGGVQARPPGASEWQPASSGIEIFRAWQVATPAQGSAELTLPDGSRLSLREETTAVLHGSGDLALMLRSPQSELLSGVLKTQLTEQSKLGVATSAAKIKLGSGSAMIRVTPDGATRVSNYEGASIKVSRRSTGDHDTPQLIEVGVSMGTKVEANGEPSEPRPLPDSPEWSPLMVTTLFATHHTGELRGSWGKVPEAESYSIEVSRDKLGAEVIQRVIVSKRATKFELTGLPVGVYYVSVASVDAEFFESKPSARVAFRVIEPAFKDPAGAVTSIEQLYAGSQFTAPAGYKCTKDELDTPKTKISLEQAGSFQLRCSDELGLSLIPLSIQVSEVRVSVADVAPGQEPLLRSGQPTKMAFTFSGAVGSSLRLQQDIYAEFTPLRKQGDGTWETTITVKDPAPPKLTVRFLTGSEKTPKTIGSVLLPVEATPLVPRTEELRPEEPIKSSKLKIGIGVLGGMSHNKTATLRGMRSSLAFAGLRIGLDAAFAAVEAEFKSSLPIDDAALEVNAGAHAKLAFAAKGLYPFVLAGFGLELAESLDPALFFYPGLGLEYKSPKGLGLRLDLRGVFVPQGIPENLFGEGSLGFFIRR
jgi:LysM repeat protein